MTLRNAAFAIPGDINTLTGGYIYERLLLDNLRSLGHDVTHIPLGASFPAATEADMAEAVEALTALPQHRALILDGLICGAIDTDGLSRVTAPIVAMIHHPLAKETGLARAVRDHLFQTEKDNLALAAQVLVPSPHTAEILTEEYAVPANRIHIAQPGTDPAPGVRAPTDPPLILTVGIQHPRKGHDTLLRALATITDIPWRSVIAGSSHDADYTRDLLQMVQELGLSDRVTLAGNVPRDTLEALYSEASVFALATRYEGYGMVFNEALSWGLPIVSCATGAVPQTVPSDAGLLVPVDAEVDLAAALQSVLTDTAQYQAMEDAARMAGLALPSWMDTARIASRVLNDLEP